MGPGQAEMLREPYPFDLSDLRKFIYTPVPKAAGIVQCHIVRDKSGTSNKLFPVYSLFLNDKETFLLTSKKRPKNKTSNYLISMARGDFDREGANYVGKLRSNFVGTEFQCFDDGFNPKDVDDADGRGGRNRNVRRELAAAVYASNVFGYRGPRKMQVVIPAVGEDDQVVSSIRPGEVSIETMSFAM